MADIELSSAIALSTTLEGLVLAARFLEASLSVSTTTAADVVDYTGNLAGAADGSTNITADASPAPALAGVSDAVVAVSGDVVRYRTMASALDNAAVVAADLSYRSGLRSDITLSPEIAASLGLSRPVEAAVSLAPQIAAAIETGGSLAQDIYMQITGAPVFNDDADPVTGNPGTWTIPVTLRRGGTAGTRIPTGAAVVKWGEYSSTPTAEFTGGIILTSDLDNAPYVDVFTVAKNDSGTVMPWDDAALKPRVRMGNLHGVLGNLTDKWGIAMSTDLSDTSAPYIEASNEGLQIVDADLNIINGDFYAGDAGETAYMRWDSALATLEVQGTIKATAGSFDGELTIGTSGGIYQGTGTFGTPTTGLKIWNDSGIGRLATYYNGAEQLSFNTNGQLYAGAGVLLDASGITFDTVMTGNTPPGYDPQPYKLKIGEGEIYYWASMDLGVGAGMYVGIPTPASDQDMELEAYEITHTANKLRYTGDLVAHRGISDYTGNIYVPLTTPLTSTSWDGDSRSTTSKTLIDLSAVFGLPAGIKAVDMRVAIRDSGSASNVCLILFGPNNTANEGRDVRCSGLPADTYAVDNLVVSCDANGDIYYQTIASGSGTLDVIVDIWGYYI